jgi:hypothetical protein
VREICKDNNSFNIQVNYEFLKIRDKSQVNKSQDYIETHLFSHLPNVLYFLRHDLSGVRNKIRAFSLFIILSRSRVIPTNSIENF